MQNLGYAVRRLNAEQGFTLVVILAIGLGIGLNTTVFTLVNAVLLRGLPYENPDEIIVASTYDSERRDDGPTSWPDFEDWRAAKSFRSLAGVSGQSSRAGSRNCDSACCPRRAACKGGHRLRVHRRPR